MKRMLRRLVLPFWWASTPFRRAVMRRFDARIVGLASSAIEARMMPAILESLSASEARLERIEALIARADRSASTMAEEVDLVLNGLSREVFRLQARVEMLGRDDRQDVGGLTLLSESEGDGPLDRPESFPPERSRVG